MSNNESFSPQMITVTYTHEKCIYCKSKFTLLKCDACGGSGVLQIAHHNSNMFYAGEPGTLSSGPSDGWYLDDTGCHPIYDNAPPPACAPPSSTPKHNKPKRPRKPLPQFSSMEELYARSPRKRETSRAPSDQLNPGSLSTVWAKAAGGLGSPMAVDMFKDVKLISKYEMDFMLKDEFNALQDAYYFHYDAALAVYRLTPKAQP